MELNINHMEYPKQLKNNKPKKQIREEMKKQ